MARSGSRRLEEDDDIAADGEVERAVMTCIRNQTEPTPSFIHTCRCTAAASTGSWTPTCCSTSSSCSLSPSAMRSTCSSVYCSDHSFIHTCDHADRLLFCRRSGGRGGRPQTGQGLSLQVRCGRLLSYPTLPYASDTDTECPGRLADFLLEHGRGLAAQCGKLKRLRLWADLTLHPPIEEAVCYQLLSVCLSLTE